MAYEVRLSRRAISDLEAIYEEKNTLHSAPAEISYLGLRDAVFSLENQPFRGTKARDRPSLRQLLYGTRAHTYRILYSIDELAKIISVAEVRHSARRPLNPL